MASALTKIIEPVIDDLKRRTLKVLRFGKSDVKTPLEAMPFGTDAVPLKDMIAVYAPVGVNGKAAIVGYVNQNQLAEPGEHRTYSVNDDHEVQSYIYLKNDGVIDIMAKGIKVVSDGENLNTVLGELVDELKLMNDNIKAITVNAGPYLSSTPLNSASFDTNKTNLDSILAKLQKIYIA